MQRRLVPSQFRHRSARRQLEVEYGVKICPGKTDIFKTELISNLWHWKLHQNGIEKFCLLMCYLSPFNRLDFRYEMGRYEGGFVERFWPPRSLQPGGQASPHTVTHQSWQRNVQDIFLPNTVGHDESRRCFRRCAHWPNSASIGNSQTYVTTLAATLFYNRTSKFSYIYSWRLDRRIFSS